MSSHILIIIIVVVGSQSCSMLSLAVFVPYTLCKTIHLALSLLSHKHLLSHQQPLSHFALQPPTPTAATEPACRELDIEALPVVGGMSNLEFRELMRANQEDAQVHYLMQKMVLLALLSANALPHTTAAALQHHLLPTLLNTVPITIASSTISGLCSWQPPIPALSQQRL